VPTIIQVTTSLPTHIPKGFDHQPPNGRELVDSLGRDSLRKPPFNPLVGPFGWLALNPHTFVPPWYQPPIVQHVLALLKIQAQLVRFH